MKHDRFQLSRGARVLAIALMLGMASDHGASATATPALAAPASAPNKQLGVASCASTLCHGSAKPLEGSSVQQNEYLTWSHFDPHSRAYRVLLEPQSRAIARRMGLQNAHEAPACLACHSDTTPPAQRGERWQLSDGIGCESCHGGSEPWIANHYQAPNNMHSENVGRGMRELAAPASRGELCIGCHVGDRNRFATHQMMAAGHPRLAFELDTYTALWRTAGGREHYRIDADYLRRKPIASAIETWLTGLAQTADRTAMLVSQAPRRAGAPDLAVYNCFSCHRSMRINAWGGAADTDGLPPGSLRVQDGHARALLALASALNDPAAVPLRRALRELRVAANDAPATLPMRTRTLHDALQRVRGSLAARQWTRAEQQAALAALTRAARSGAFADYAAAEQAAMGMMMLLAELDLDRSQHAQIDRLFRELAHDTQFNAARFNRSLAAAAGN